MGKSTTSESMPTIAPRDHVAPETPLSERPLVPKSHAASKYRKGGRPSRTSISSAETRSVHATDLP